MKQMAVVAHAATGIARIATDIAAASTAAIRAAAAVFVKAMVVVAAAGVHEIATPEIPDAGRGVVAGARAIDVATVIAIHGHRRGLVGRRGFCLGEGGRVYRFAEAAPPALSSKSLAAETLAHDTLAAKQAALKKLSRRLPIAGPFGRFSKTRGASDDHQQCRCQSVPSHGYSSYLLPGIAVLRE
jgi:hypothetical protein